MATHPTLQKILETAGKFVADQKGDWDHDAWEKLLAKMDKLGLVMDDEAKRNLGNILEASRQFYLALPAPARKRKTSTKVKAKAKAKKR